MFTTIASFSLLLLAPLALASPTPEAEAFTLPVKTLPNGNVNPFYPCGTNPASCPYRCYILPLFMTNGTAANLSKLQRNCYTQAAAASFIAGAPQHAGHACVKCTQPDASEIPKTANSPLNCQPLDTYFASTASYGTAALQEFGTAPWSPPYPKAALPARCGSRANPVPECAWDCGAAQVPFSLCDSHNTTGDFRQCRKDVPQCSSPVPVGGNAAVARGPHLSDVGACARGKASVECPWACTQAGRSGNNGEGPIRFCSVVDKTNSQNGGFVTCDRCLK